MRVVAYGRPERQAGLSASVKGLAALGFDVKVFDGKPSRDFTPEPCSFAVIEGTRSEHRWIYEAHRDRKDAPTLLIVEYGYLARASSPEDDKGKYWQVSLNHLGWVPDYQCSSERFDALGVAIGKLREPSDDLPIIIVGDHPGFPDAEDDFRWPDIRHWAVTALDEIRKHTKRRVFWRPHPRQQVGIPGFNGLSIGPIDWAQQWACVVFNSNTGNEALIKGCPVFTDGWAGFRQVSNTDLAGIEAPILPPLDDYFHRLAHGQWLLAEIEKGLPFAEYIEKGLLPCRD